MITSGSEITARAHFDFALKMQLRAVMPGSGDTFLTERGGAGSLSAPIPLRQNGTYKVYLKGWPSGHVYDSNTFTVRIPPATPSGVSASTSGGKVVVNWNLGLEDDLSGYTVSAGSAGSKSGSASSLCSGTTCSTSFSVPSNARGSLPVQVRAKRPSGTGGSVYSTTASATVTIGGGSNSGGGPSDLPPGSGDLPPGTTSPSPSTPLTPFNNQSPVTLPSVQPDGATPGFTYPTPQVLNPTAPRAKNVAATDELQWGKSIGIALVLLIVAAHLGTWTRSLRVAQTGVSHQGMAARIARGGTGRKRVKKSREHIARAEALAKTSTLTPPVKPTGAAGGKQGQKTGDKRPRRADQAPKPNAPSSKITRRPATLGRDSSGVSVRIAKPNAGTSPAPKPGAQPKKSSRRRRSK
ncbi:hypothetical protein [Spirillospora sp. CA-294931]|uniref:hypothetical protein n=1 Tax=Spirillospora sp. CA-294931 TaxID=3240042 RepID=UPI003D903688